MYINEWNINEAAGRQFNVTMGNQSVSHSSEWVAGSVVPRFSGVNPGFKTCSVTILAYGNSRNEARLHVSEILGHCAGEAVDLTLDGFDTIFRGVLKGHTVTEQKRIAGWKGWRRFVQLVLTFEGYEFGPGIIQKRTLTAGTAKIMLVNPGTYKTPVMIKISCHGMTQNKISLTGLASGDVTINRVYYDDIFTLSGEDGILSASTATDPDSVTAADADLLDLPWIKPGKTDLVITGAGAGTEVTVIFNPRYI